MKCVRTLLCSGVAMVLSVSLLGGCTSSQQARWLQEKEELEKTIETQQTEIEQLRVNVEATKGVSKELQECHKLRTRMLEALARGRNKKGNNPETKQVSKKNRNPGTQPKAKSTKKKAGCSACSKRRRK